MLDDLIMANRQEIIARTRAKVSARSSPRPADVELDKGIPLFLDQVSETLRLSMSRATVMGANAAQHGGALLRMGFTVSQVVHGYGDVCQAVTEVALESGTPISTDDFRTFNRCLDEAIASAVTEYERQREEGISRLGAERLGILAHELRNSLSTALLAFGSLKRGVVGPDSSTGALLNRSLLRLRDLIDRSLSEVRLESGLVHLEHISVNAIIQDVAIGAAVDAGNRGISFTVAPLATELVVRADQQLLIGAIENLLQNALKFTHRDGHVSLTAHQLEGQVLIDVADECGGLPPGKADQLFGAFEQRGTDRTGLGLGLWISRASVNAIGGRLSVRDVPGKGCVFTIALPQLTAAS